MPASRSNLKLVNATPPFPVFLFLLFLNRVSLFEEHQLTIARTSIHTMMMMHLGRLRLHRAASKVLRGGKRTRQLPLVSLSGQISFSSSANRDDSSSRPPPNSFQVLGLPERFAIDDNELKQSYRKLMIDYHPDKHTAKSADDQEELEQQASAVTRAYQTLKQPHTRAVHLLDVVGHPTEEAASGELVGGEFLMEIMEIREEIQATLGDEALRKLLHENQARIDETCVELAEAFDENDLDKALELTARLQYWNRIDETIREKMDSVHAEE